MSPPSIPRLTRSQRTLLVKRDAMNLSYECVIRKDTQEIVEATKLTMEELVSDLKNKLAASHSLNSALNDEIGDLKDQIKSQSTELMILNGQVRSFVSVRSRYREFGTQTTDNWLTSIDGECQVDIRLSYVDSECQVDLPRLVVSEDCAGSQEFVNNRIPEVVASRDTVSSPIQDVSAASVNDNIPDIRNELDQLMNQTKVSSGVSISTPIMMSPVHVDESNKDS